MNIPYVLKIPRALALRLGCLQIPFNQFNVPLDNPKAPPSLLVYDKSMPFRAGPATGAFADPEAWLYWPLIPEEEQA